jgi:hypothetical protein
MFVVPKLYYLDTVEEGPIIKAKGIGAQNLTKEDFENIIKGDSITKNRHSFKYIHTSVINSSTKITLTPTLNNRIAIYEDGYFVATKPIKIP